MTAIAFVRTARFLFLAAVVACLGMVGASPTQVSANEAAIVTAGSLDDHEAESGDMDDHTAESHEMDEGESEDPEDLLVESHEADVVESSLPAAHQGTSVAIDDLDSVGAEAGFEAIDMGRLDGINEVHLDAHQLLAKRRLERAQANAMTARTRYGDMMENDYPRGEARLRITKTRDDTMAALKRARIQFDEAMAN